MADGSGAGSPGGAAPVPDEETKKVQEAYDAAVRAIRAANAAKPDVAGAEAVEKDLVPGSEGDGLAVERAIREVLRQLKTQNARASSVKAVETVIHKSIFPAEYPTYKDACKRLGAKESTYLQYQKMLKEKGVVLSNSILLPSAPEALRAAIQAVSEKGAEVGDPPLTTLVLAHGNVKVPKTTLFAVKAVLYHMVFPKEHKTDEDAWEHFGAASSTSRMWKTWINEVARKNGLLHENDLLHTPGAPSAAPSCSPLPSPPGAASPAADGAGAESPPENGVAAAAGAEGAEGSLSGEATGEQQHRGGGEAGEEFDDEIKQFLDLDELDKFFDDADDKNAPGRDQIALVTGGDEAVGKAAPSPTSPATPATPATPASSSDSSASPASPASAPPAAPAAPLAPPAPSASAVPPAADDAEGGGVTAWARCARPDCPCVSFNGLPGEHCCRTCRGTPTCAGKPCATLVHREPSEKPRPQPPIDAGRYARCVREGCPCTSSFDGQPGEYCCLSCRNGKPCEGNYHREPSRRSRKGMRVVGGGEGGGVAAA